MSLYLGCCSRGYIELLKICLPRSFRMLVNCLYSSPFLLFVTRQIACHSHTRKTKARQSRRASPWHATSYTHKYAQPPHYSFPSATFPPSISRPYPRPEETDQHQLQQELAVAEHQRASLSHAADRSSRCQLRVREKERERETQ